MRAADPGQIELLVPEWPVPRCVQAAFTVRTGGVSAAPYDSLNLATHVGDRDDAVIENRRRLHTRLNLSSEPRWMTQVHGTQVWDLDALPAANESLTADAAVSRRPGSICAVQVADCMPVLFAACDGSVIAAAHAGWRGLAAGVLESTVTAMAVPPGQLVAWIGPAISARYFEVGNDVQQAFLARAAQARSAFSANTRGRWQCDLVRLCRQRLDAIGIGGVFGGNWCTYGEPTRFFSYRRDGQCGRMAALIWISG